MYQVEDFTGPIEGATFATYAEAYDYREFILSDYEEGEEEVMKLREEQDAAAHYRKPRPVTLEQVRASIRAFIFIEVQS